MKLALFIVLALVAFSAASPAKRGSSSSSSTSFDDLAQSILESWPIDLETAEMVAQLVLDYNFDDVKEAPMPPPIDLSCPSLPARTPATTIGLLHPQDIVAVGAIGDSLTCASNALSTTWLNLKQYPGLSWSIGGDASATTMPNILSNFAGTIFGTSTGVGDGVRNFNLAVGGAVVQDMPGQATNLVNAMKASTLFDYENDWKLVTLFIGGNNLCLVCDDGEYSSNDAAVYKDYMEQTLNILQGMPKTLVTVNSHFDYTQLAEFKGPFCAIALGFVCDCLTSTNSAKQAAAREMMYQYNAVLLELQDEYNDPSRDDWAMVVQTFLVNTTIPNDEYISTADCFHPSGQGQAFFGQGLWNSLISPMDAKPVAQAPGLPLLCPTVDTLLFNPQSPSNYSYYG